MVWPRTSSTSNWSHRPAARLRIMRGKSLAKNSAAPITNSPSDWLNTPLPLVRATGLSTNSGNNIPSRPAARECTQRTRGAIFQTCCRSFRPPAQLQITCASGASLSKASGLFPTAIDVESGNDSSMASWGSVGSERTKTVILSMRRKHFTMFDLSLEVLRVVEQAAIESERTMGMGNAEGADHAAVESMRATLDTIAIEGTIVIGEGERDEAPMLYIGEKVGADKDKEGAMKVDIAVDPLEGTNLCASGGGGAITVLASSEHGGLLHAPDCYMEKIVVGPAAKGSVDLDVPVKQNLKSIARRLQRGVDDLVVVVLDRPRHEQLITDIREAGARIRLIADGDLSAGIAAAVSGTGVHAVMGSGGAPEGVLTAAALQCLNGEILGRLVVKDGEQAERMQSMGIHDPRKVYTTKELAPGRNVLFAACGVTDGNLLKGIRFFGDGIRTQSIVMTLNPARVRFIDTVHLENRPDVKVRFA